MMRAEKRAAVGLAIALALLLFTIPDSNAANADIKFVVKTVDGSTAVQGAVVKLNGTTQATTNSQGEATITANPLAENSVTVEFRGILVYSNIVNTTLVDPSPPYVVTLRVNVTTLTVKVVSDTGVAVPRAEVTVEHGTSIMNTATTDSDGRASIPLMPYTTYRVKVSYRGYVVYDSDREFSGGLITVSAALFRMTVNVLDASDNGVPGSLVKIWYGSKPAGNNTGFSSGTTDSGGVVRLDLLPDGEYHLEVEYKDENVYTSPSRVVIDGASITYNARTDLVRYSLTVYDADGTDVISGSQYRISAELLRGSYRYSGATTTTGILDLGIVKPREYTLVLKLGEHEVFRGQISAPSDNSVRAKFYDILVRVEAPRTPSEPLLREVGLKMNLDTVFTLEGTTRDSGISFNNVPAGRYRYEITHGPYAIGSGEANVDAEGKKITLTPTLNTLTLNIKNADGEAIAGKAYLSTYQGDRIGVYDADEDGVVRVSDLIPIMYSVYVEYRGVRVLDPVEIVLDSNREESLLTKVYNIVLEILDADGKDHLAEALSTIEGGSIIETGESGENGTVLVRNLPVGQYSVSIEYLGIPVHREDLRVDASKNFKISAKSVVDVDIEVVDSESNPLESGSVEIVFGRARFSGEVADGKTRFENVPAGAYRTVVNYLGSVVYDKPITISVDEDKIRILASVYYLTIVAKKADDTPLTGSQVKASASNRLIGQAITDSGGRAELKLPKGDYSLDVFYQGVAVASQIVSVAESSSINIQTRVYRIDVKILTPDGLPVEGAEITLSRDDSVIVTGQTDEAGESLVYLAEGDYDWVTRIGEYTYSSVFKAKESKSLTLLHVVDNLQNQGIVLGATAAVSASSVFGLLRWGRPRVRATRQRQAPARRSGVRPAGEGSNLKRPRMPRI